MPATKLLPAVGHAVSGSAGTAISTLTTYPLDLVNTRLKVQRQLRRDGAIASSEEYDGLVDAFRKIYAREGGLPALYAGLGSDVAKSVVDSFLFFLFYTWFRSRRLGANARHLPVWEELAVGAAAGACSRAFTTPISNVVTRKQTATLVGGVDTPGKTPSTAEILHVIRAEKGLLGLWSGYSASLVLTLNPSITFFLQQVLKKSLVSSEKWDSPGSATTFLVAAMSKVIATAATFPFQIAKARLQVSAPQDEVKQEVAGIDVGGSSSAGKDAADSESPKQSARAVARGIRSLTEDNIFTTVARIARKEGVSALYDGITGELLKAFFSHGTTMLSKDVVHRLIVQLYFVVLDALKKLPDIRAAIQRRSQQVSEQARSSLGRRLANSTTARRRQNQLRDGDDGSHGAVVVNMQDGSQRKTER